MRKFQLRFCDSKGCGHFIYFEADKTKPGVIEITAAEKATEHLQKQRAQDAANRFNPFRQPYKPKRVVHVWEWDYETKAPKKKGYRFKIHYAYIKATLANGNKAFDEWYRYEG